MRLILSTSNVMSGGSSIRRSPTTKSNLELVTSLRSSFDASSTLYSSDDTSTPESNGHGQGPDHKADYRMWTRLSADHQTLEVPALDFSESALQEEREAYDITVKLFFLPGEDTTHREAHTREAVDLVLKELHVSSIDLLIVCFPAIYFDEEEDCPDKISTRGPIEAEPESLQSQIETWRILEKLCEEGLAKKLGLAEFGHERLQNLLEKGDLKVRPSVNQINLRDCCSVPKPLLALGRREKVELLVHNDCSNILPKGTVRELLGPGPVGAGVLASGAKTGDKRKSLHGEGLRNGTLVGEGVKGEVLPQWVVKYTAVIHNRGVVEDKGYFAMAEIVD
ncbi:hypothetical protein K431DRAFT_293799 [Polychaeton citri CBS 116435]|uniref:GCS light chain n=1 Tax=Polychaeton citri CBS 116435 TaxID=1314669 RepID=A0A9P4Q8T1_9PEZI|nr:hypothetical protein K431DRAFT_293799 [Polychaeton citri CBS 116435]